MADSNPKFSVVITVYHDLVRLENTLKGWANQTNKDFEVIVVNDGGDDFLDLYGIVPKILRAANISNFVDGTTLKPKNGKQVFRLAQARNVGLRESSGQYCIISDCDTIPHPTVVETFNKYVRDDRVLIGVRKRIPINLVPKIPETKDLETLVGSIDERLSNKITSVLFNRLKDRADGWDLCWGCLFCAPLNKMKELGGFDEKFVGWGAEDTDMAERLVRGVGCLTYSLPEAFVYHQDHLPRDPFPYKADKVLAEIRANWTAVRNGGPIK